MKTLQAAPPNYDEVCSVFDVRGKHVAFTYGDTVYHPMDRDLQDHVKAHESVHIAQQLETGIKAWWDEYLQTPSFRLDQELEAYRRQYQFCKQTMNREQSRAILNDIARDLSGAMYGHMVSFVEAKQLIKQS